MYVEKRKIISQNKDLAPINNIKNKIEIIVFTQVMFQKVTEIFAKIIFHLF